MIYSGQVFSSEQTLNTATLGHQLPESAQQSQRQYYPTTQLNIERDFTSGETNVTASKSFLNSSGDNKMGQSMPLSDWVLERMGKKQ